MRFAPKHPRHIAAWLAVGLALAAALLVAAWQLQGRQPQRFDPAALERYYRALPAPAAKAVDAALLDAGIEAAAGYIRSASQADGRFTYLVNTNPAVPVVPGYSMLRHAGTVYALGMAQARRPDAQNLVVMERAVAFMRRCCLTHFEALGLWGLWEPPGFGPTVGPAEYKLGGAGLGLVAMASLDAVQPGAVPMHEMRGLARFGQFLQRADGEFYAKYVPAAGGRTQAGWVMFYPGEMALGWLTLYERDPQPTLIAAASKALTAMADQRAAAGKAPADHWALLATARLFRLAERDGLPIPREALLQHALQIAHTMLEEASGPARLPIFEGILVSAGRGETTPTATRLEALLAAATFLPLAHPITPHLVSAAHRGTGFLLRAQLKDGPYAGGMPQAVSTLPDDGSEAAAKFNAQATEIRIDYVQHALSAMIQHAQWSLTQR